MKVNIERNCVGTDAESTVHSEQMHSVAGKNCLAMRQHCVIVARRHSVVIHTLTLSFCSNTHSLTKAESPFWHGFALHWAVWHDICWTKFITELSKWVNQLPLSYPWTYISLLDMTLCFQGHNVKCHWNFLWIHHQYALHNTFQNWEYVVRQLLVTLDSSILQSHCVLLLDKSKVLSLPESVNVTFHECTEWDNTLQDSKYFAVSLLPVTVLLLDKRIMLPLSECQCHYCWIKSARLATVNSTTHESQTQHKKVKHWYRKVEH